MPETKQRRRTSPPSGTHRPKPSISRPRRTSTAKPGRFSRGWTFRTTLEPERIALALGAMDTAYDKPLEREWFTEHKPAWVPGK